MSTNAGEESVMCIYYCKSSFIFLFFCIVFGLEVWMAMGEGLKESQYERSGRLDLYIRRIQFLLFGRFFKVVTPYNRGIHKCLRLLRAMATTSMLKYKYMRCDLKRIFFELQSYCESKLFFMSTYDDCCWSVIYKVILRG